MPEPIYDTADLDGEEWRPIPGYETSYEVSNLGRVKSLARNNHRARILRANAKHHGYRSVCLYRDWQQKRIHVHRLVLTAFVGECPDGWHGCHRDADTSNNQLTNLYWGSPVENAQDAIRMGNNYRLRITRCPQGHAYDDENTRLYRNWRYCRTCQRDRHAPAAALGMAKVRAVLGKDAE